MRSGEPVPEFCLVMTTAPTPEAGRELARALVEAGLAGCVQLVGIESFYIWEGESTASPEVLLLVKTRAARYAEIEAFVGEYHEYEVPELVRLWIDGGSAGYLSWLSAATGGSAG